MNRYDKPFVWVDGTAPSFNVVATTPSAVYALESSGIREWSGPGGRSLRFACSTAADYHIQYGSTLAVASTDTPLMLGGTVEIPAPIRPGHTHIAFWSSTDVTVNVTLGYGG
jgi:hypothetical protein